jgi:hypothetical protein
VLGRSFASSSLFSSGSNGKLNINLSSVAVEIEPVKNLTFQSGLSYRTLESLRHLVWNYTDAGKRDKSTVNQSKSISRLVIHPTENDWVRCRDNVTVLSVGFVNYSHGFKGLLNSDFKYEKIVL